ncbi:ras GEF [Anaeromyces robustus]|uniref:Ras GEF n=1 Tax=Anaeromyces robustus TaxID=1754192 RepID=A0A1Y1X8X9_9FUNG|nr:ras GEF [Anaeromyces robustus]|eukprot:ORX82221.1 ras GEF [Anaeromyces robustus]
MSSMKKRASLSISTIKFSNSKKILKSLKEQESNISENELPNINDLRIDTESISTSDYQIPNNKAFCKMLSSSVVDNSFNSYDDNSFKNSKYGKKSNTLPIMGSTHKSGDKRLSDINETNDIRKELFRHSSGKITKTNLDDCVETSPKFTDVNINVFETDPKDIARQMCLMNAKIFKQITQDELLSLAWNKPNKKVKAPNIVLMTEQFNKITLWVSNNILSSALPSERTQKIARFIYIEKACLKNNDFHSLKSIISALESTPIHRLEKTWMLLPKKEKAKHKKYATLMSMERNSEEYRKYLQECKGAKIPYLGLYLSDITYLFEAIEKEKTLSQVKLEQKLKLDRLLNEFEEYQKAANYQFNEIQWIQQELNSEKFINEIQHTQDEHYLTSIQLEPKKNKSEQDSTSDSKPTHNISMKSVFNKLINNHQKD